MEGENYRIETMATGIVEGRVWKRPDLSVEVGAQLAKAMCAELEALARSQLVKAILFDLTEAPPAFGAKTEEVMTGVLRASERVKKPIVLLVGEASIQRLQLERIVRAGAPTCGRLFRQRAAAEAWLAEALGR